MPSATRTELFTRLVELCDEFRSHGGIGCEVAVEQSHTRFGLWSIDQRLRALDAVLDIEAAAGNGTRAMVILPRRLVVAG